jgi:isopenicillin N synthase-like dioxygenase
MKLEIISYYDLFNPTNSIASNKLKTALFQTGIVGIHDVPQFQEKSRAYISAAQQFSSLDDKIKQQYVPDRDAGDTEGYELGAEWFKDQNGNWQVDDKKASFYAFVPDRSQNKWPREVDLKNPYLNLGELIFKTGKHLLNFIGMDNAIGIHHDSLIGYGRMLHYHKEKDTHNNNLNWCGAHFDHGIFTGLVPAYYFQDGKEVDEPDDTGLFILPTYGKDFEKVHVEDKSVLLFQVGEFGQLASHDQIRATKHLVRKAQGNIERFAFALFYIPDENAVIHSKSELIKDARYKDNMAADGSIKYGNWSAASYARYRAI